MPRTARTISLKVSADNKGKMSLALVRGQATVASMIIDAKEAASVAGMVLGAAKRAHELSGKPQPYQTKDDPVSLTAVQCSGWNIGPGQSPETTMLIFHFGETTLGISIPHATAQLFAQRLMTAAADQTGRRQ
jgi:hypothetical protein